MTALVLYHDTYACTAACTGSAGATAPDLVLLHGWGMHSVVWDPIVPALLEHYQVTVIDLPGMGRSPLPGGHYDLDYVIQHLLAVAPARAVWMGWSLGGEIATAIAARHPERVSALLLVASNPSFAQRDDWSCAMASQQLQQFRDFYEEDPEGTLIRFLSLQCRGSRRMKEDIRFLQEILYLQGLPAPQALRAGLRLLAELDVRADFQRLSQPVQFLLGANDVLVPEALAPALLALVEGTQRICQITVLAESGHVPFLSEPDAFLAAALPFLVAQRG